MLRRTLMEILNKIKSFFFKSNVKEEDIKEVGNSKRYASLLECKCMDRINLNQYPPIVIGSEKKKDNANRNTKEIDKDLPILLFVEDYEDMRSAYRIVLNNISKQVGKSVYDSFNICEAYGKFCGGTALKFVNETKVDYAILDITLGEVINVNEGGYVFINGIDIAIEILKKNPEAKILFLTGHTLNDRYPAFKEYIEKFRKHTGKNIIDHYLKKSDVNDESFLLEFLYGVKNG